MNILNLTQHNATPAQLEAGVVDFDGADRATLVELLTFNKLPTKAEIRERAKAIVGYAAYFWNIVPELDSVMIGGAPFLMPTLEKEFNLAQISGKQISVLYAYSERTSEEVHQPDGSVRKVNVFKHVGFVEV